MTAAISPSAAAKQQPYYMARLFAFLDELTANNNREWFAARRAEYDELRALWLADLDRMIAAMARWCPALAAQTGRDAAYRIYRDTRFSHDKTPFKTYFSAAVSDRGRKTMRAGFYIEIGNARTFDQGIYAGIWALEPAMLRKMRHAIVDNIEEWEAIVDAPALRRDMPQWCCHTLKTIPKGWERSHPQAEYLRMTNYGRFRSLDREFFMQPDWPERVADIFRSAAPFVDFINYSLDE